MNATILNHPHQLMSKESANQLADKLNNDADDDWTYTAVHCPNGTGWSFVEIHEADGTFVGRI